MDRGIAGDLNNIRIAEGIVGHRWNSMGTEENRDKYVKNTSKSTMYEYNPKLDHNIIVSQANLANAESTVGHAYKSPLIHNDLMT